MVDLPQSLRAVYTATLRERDGSYVIKVPKCEVEYDAVSPGEVCRVALIDHVSETSDDADSPSGGSSERTGSDPSGPPVTEGEVREVTVESLGDKGDGIAKVERGYVVIVPDAIRVTSRRSGSTARRTMSRSRVWLTATTGRCDSHRVSDSPNIQAVSDESHRRDALPA